MKKILFFGTAVTALGLAMPAAGALEGDAAAGAETAVICNACHQPDGSGMNIPGGESWPRLAGQNAEYMFKQLQDFKSGVRQNASMLPFASMLDEQQMKNVAVHFSQMPATEGKGAEQADEALLAKGRKLAMEGNWDSYVVPCKSCHGPANQGVGSDFPGIAGQHAGYIADQLRKWQKGERDNDPQHLMLAIAERLTEDEIQAVSAWLATQPAR